MKGTNLTNQLMSGLELQKEYLILELKEKVLYLSAVISFALSLFVLGTGLFYIFSGSTAALCFATLYLILISIITFTISRKTRRIITVQKQTISTLQDNIKQQLSQLFSPPDILLSLHQTICLVSDIIREVKALFNQEQSA